MWPSLGEGTTPFEGASRRKLLFSLRRDDPLEALQRGARIERPLGDAISGIGLRRAGHLEQPRREVERLLAQVGGRGGIATQDREHIERFEARPDAESHRPVRMRGVDLDAQSDALRHLR